MCTAQRRAAGRRRPQPTRHNAVELAVEAGQALLEAKKRCPRGAWHTWLNQHFRGSIRTAQAYLRLAVFTPLLGQNAQRRAHLTYDQLRCMLTGLAPADGRSQPKRKRRAAIEAATAAPPSTPPEQRLCGDPICLRIVHVDADFRHVAESLLETLRELAALTDHQTAGDYALHLFERLRMVYCGLGRRQWFHEWHVPPVANPQRDERRSQPSFAQCDAAPNDDFEDRAEGDGGTRDETAGRITRMADDHSPTIIEQP